MLIARRQGGTRAAVLRLDSDVRLQAACIDGVEPHPGGRGGRDQPPEEIGGVVVTGLRENRRHPVAILQLVVQLQAGRHRQAVGNVENRLAARQPAHHAHQLLHGAHREGEVVALLAGECLDLVERPRQGALVLS